MNHNFNKLTIFETLTVALIAIGIVIIAVALFMGLPGKDQAALSSAFQMLDVNVSIADANQVYGLVFESAEKYLDEFYLAFTQTAALPESHLGGIVSSVQKVLVYADLIAADYQRTTIHQEQGSIAGISISTDIDVACNPNEQGLLCRFNLLSNP